MKLAHIDQDKLSISKANMRDGKKPPDIADILPSVRARGVLVPLLVRQNPCPEPVEGGSAETFEIVAGRRRYYAALEVANENGVNEPLPCAIMEAGDDAAALEASMLENYARRDPDEVTLWESMTLLVKQGRSVDEISCVFGMAELRVKRILALGNLLPRIRQAFRNGEIDAVSIRHLTLATKAQQKTWMSLFDDPDGYAPRGHNLKGWLFGGTSISTSVALFDLECFEGRIVTDLFEEQGYFADPDAFLAAQNAAIEERKTAYIDAGWSDVVMIASGDQFRSWEFVPTTKRKGGRVYVEMAHTGEVTFHEGYLSIKEARRVAKGESVESVTATRRPEMTGPMTTYVDLHRHAAVRAALTETPAVSLRLMVAHALCGSTLWTIKVEPQTARSAAIAESIETSIAEAKFDERRRAVIELLGLDAEDATVTGSLDANYGMSSLFLRLLELPDPAVYDVMAVVMGETLASGSLIVETLGDTLNMDMREYWTADDAFFGLIRDREVMTRMVAEVAGETVASGNATEAAKVQKQVLRDYIEGSNGRTKADAWVPRWMVFPPSAYTQRGGVATVDRHTHFAERQAEESEARHQAEYQAEDERAAPASAEGEMPEPETLPEVEEMRLAA